MRFNFKIHSVSPTHVNIIVFANGANTGEICFNLDEAVEFLVMQDEGAGNHEVVITGRIDELKKRYINKLGSRYGAEKMEYLTEAMRIGRRKKE